jgi:hypothetical protein
VLIYISITLKIKCFYILQISLSLDVIRLLAHTTLFSLCSLFTEPYFVGGQGKYDCLLPIRNRRSRFGARAGQARTDYWTWTRFSWIFKVSLVMSILKLFASFCLNNILVFNFNGAVHASCFKRFCVWNYFLICACGKLYARTHTSQGASPPFPIHGSVEKLLVHSDTFGKLLIN